ncbi:MAG: 50S ribosomal protein L9 [Methylococcaceae bacterium]|nr:50S ribosomal protein L9 [Methylococcaceae bacterium]MCI0668457.1 50S ribosomal protein L9 [Methylococcaceae bacterium]MCI0734413.1 50S ribosomal protein L9 [Methylococcaceae bacterium]
MDLILLEKIPNLGNLGDRVKVKPGYGRNYLLPKRKAVLATAEKLAEFERRRAELETKAAEQLAAAESRRDSLTGVKITIIQKAGDEGKLFGSVGTYDIAEAATKAGCPLERHEIRLSEGLLRHTGDYEIDVQFHSDVVAKLSLSIVAE